MDPITISLIMMAASVLISSLLIHQQKPPKPAALEDFDIPQVEEGTPQAVVFGQAWSKGWQVLWWGELATKKIKMEGKK